MAGGSAPGPMATWIVDAINASWDAAAREAAQKATSGSVGPARRASNPGPVGSAAAGLDLTLAGQSKFVNRQISAPSATPVLPPQTSAAPINPSSSSGLGGMLSDLWSTYVTATASNAQIERQAQVNMIQLGLDLANAVSRRIDNAVSQAGGGSSEAFGFKLAFSASVGQMSLTSFVPSSTVTVIHFTDEAGVGLIGNSSLRAGTYITYPGEVAGLDSLGVESALEIQAGRIIVEQKRAGKCGVQFPRLPLTVSPSPAF